MRCSEWRRPTLSQTPTPSSPVPPQRDRSPAATWQRGAWLLQADSQCPHAPAPSPGRNAVSAVRRPIRCLHPVQPLPALPFPEGSPPGPGPTPTHASTTPSVAPPSQETPTPRRAPDIPGEGRACVHGQSLAEDTSPRSLLSLNGPQVTSGSQTLLLFCAPQCPHQQQKIERSSEFFTPCPTQSWVLAPPLSPWPPPTPVLSLSLARGLVLAVLTTLWCVAQLNLAPRCPGHVPYSSGAPPTSAPLLHARDTLN